MLDHGLASAKVPLAFAFRKALPAVPAPLGVPMMKAAPAPPPPMPNRMRKRGARVHVSPPPVSPTSDTETTLESIGRVADQGQLEEAGRACEAYLREREPTADALLLLGLIRDAAGNSAGV